MTKKEFTIAFDGPAVDDGLIAVSDLAPALLSLGELFQEAHRVLEGEDSTARLNVRADPRAGCFEIDLQIAITMAAQLKAFLAGDGADAAERLFELIIKGSEAAGGVGLCLIGLMTWLKRRSPESSTTIEGGNVELTVEGESRSFPADVLRLYNNPKIRNSAYKMVRPLRVDSIERIEFREAGETIAQITYEEVAHFEPVETPERTVEEDTREVALEIITATFDETRLWRMNDGASTFNVGIADTAFQETVDSGLRFGKGDVLRVELHSEQVIMGDGKLSKRYTILRVIDRLPAPDQIALFQPDGDVP